MVIAVTIAGVSRKFPKIKQVLLVLDPNMLQFNFHCLGNVVTLRKGRKLEIGNSLHLVASHDTEPKAQNYLEAYFKNKISVLFSTVAAPNVSFLHFVASFVTIHILVAFLRERDRPRFVYNIG